MTFFKGDSRLHVSGLKKNKNIIKNGYQYHKEMDVITTIQQRQISDIVEGGGGSRGKFPVPGSQEGPTKNFANAKNRRARAVQSPWARGGSRRVSYNFIAGMIISGKFLELPKPIWPPPCFLN